MSNLSIENIAGTLQGGNVDGFLGAGGVATPTAPEGLAVRTMQKEGMAAPSAAGDAAKGFGQMFSEAIEKVNEAQHAADDSIKNLTAGRTKNIHETMLAIEKADSSLKLMMQVRNKVLDAYKEIMRMQV